MERRHIIPAIWTENEKQISENLQSITSFRTLKETSEEELRKGSSSDS